MTNCDICGFHMEDASQSCPNCEKLKRKKTMPAKNYTEAELASMPICETCGNHYENTESNQKICPHCREIRMEDSVTRQPGGKTAAQREAERKAAQYEKPVEQVVFQENKLKQYLPVIFVVAIIVIAVGAAVVMGG